MSAQSDSWFEEHICKNKTPLNYESDSMDDEK